MNTDMKKIKNIFTLLVVALVGLSLTACSNDDLGTNQYTGGVSLNAYGPNPVMRGGQLRFVGSNLDQIASITIPGVGEITNIEVVKAGVPSEIRITVPKDGPQVGYVTLKTKTDQTITTKTQLEFIEGIEITKIPEETVMPGQVIRIEGDYLNLINSLAFADGVLVSSNDFVAQDRYYIDVTVPEEAKSGKIELYTADLTVQLTKEQEDALTYQTIVSEDALTIGLPSTSKIKSPRGEAEVDGEITAKAGETITLTGNYYNVISAIKFAEVEITEFEVSENGTTLSFTLPANAPDGVFSLVCKSGENVPVASLVSVKPSNCTAAPNPVKAGAELTISGQDMDVVTAVQFTGADAITGDNMTIAADKVVVKAVPETATDGTLQLIMANGSTVDVEFTLVKPVATNYSANPASAGSPIQITGTNLDLVKSVTFGEATNAEDAFEVNTDGTMITVTVPMAGTSGKPKLNLANGTSVEAPELTIEEAVFCYVTQLPDEDNTPAAGDLLTLPVQNGDKLEKVEYNGVEIPFVYTEKNSTISFTIPSNSKAAAKFKLISSNGEIEYTLNVIPNTEIYTTIWEGAWECAGWAGNQDLAWGGYDWSSVAAGSTLKIYLRKTTQGSWGCISLRHGTSWGALPNPPIPGQYDLEDGDVVLDVVLTQEVLDDLVANSGMVITGDNYILSKIVLNEHIELEETIWSGSWNCSGWAGNQDLAWGGYDWSGLKAGVTVRFYYTKITAGSWGCISLRHGTSWGALPDPIPGQYDFPDDSGVIEVVFPANVLEDIVANSGLVITGDNYTLTKVTVE